MTSTAARPGPEGVHRARGSLPVSLLPAEKCQDPTKLGKLTENIHSKKLRSQSIIIIEE